MADIIFIKQPGESHVPVTVRIKWLPNGTIKPIKYWTPDDSCYVVKRVYETMPLALLKDNGEGVRFRVSAEIEGGAEQFIDYHHVTQHETYLYFLSNFFCGKNIIDDRYKHSGKEYIPVTLDVFPSGNYELVSFEVHGTTYIVDRTVHKEPRGSFLAGGIGVRHDVKSRRINPNSDGLGPLTGNNRDAALYLELDKWFVRIKAS